MAIMTVEEWQTRADKDFPYGVRAFPPGDNNIDVPAEVGKVVDLPDKGICLTVWPNHRVDLFFELDKAEVTSKGWWVDGAEGRTFLRPLDVTYKGKFDENNG